ncbi:MAG: FdhF/YdeP family oxidoreductase [Porticoccus sp.]|nr:FdhF/YdeP family oxidoreductase [Porticoccus sp.]
MSDNHNRQESKNIIGGGTKKVMYTLNTVRKIGLKNSSKALSSKNTCKACGLGMGGQQGGMTNELGEFPAVCNKSIQAQSTDIQPAIPPEIFQHSLSELRELSGYELEHLGRLGNPLFKEKNARHFREVSWEWAITYAAEKFSTTEPSRSFFYSSGRSSNEAGFVFQLLARLYGTNNVNNCSYYCHQATSEALGSTIGTGTATVELEDLSHCDMVFVIGANPASNHPRFIHQLKGVRDRGGKVIIINPAKEPGLVRFAVPKSAKSMITGGTWIASEYLQPAIGSDIALFKGIAKSVLEKQGENSDFISQHTEKFDAFRRDIENTHWQTIELTTGISREQIHKVADQYIAAQHVIFAWGMGMTHHQHGVENIEYISNLALLRGMIGKPGAGLLPLRGHSNVQGIGTIGVKPVLAEDIFHNIESELGIQLPTSKGMDTLACIEAAHKDAIDTALIMGGNLYGATPNSTWAKEALDNIGFKLFLTTTLNLGHIHGCDTSESMILPVTARDEEWQPTTQESMFNYVRLSDGGIERHENTRPEVVVLSDLAQLILVDCPIDFRQFKQHKNIRAAIAKVIPGMEQLADIDVKKQEFHIGGRLKHGPKFNMPEGKARFKVQPLPPQEKTSEYPLTLMTVRSEGQFNTIIYEETDSYRNTQERWSVLMSPTTIQYLGIQNNVVNLVSAYGRMDHVRVYPFDLPDNNLMAYFPEANVLIGCESDPRSKTPAFKSVLVKVELV